MKLANIPSKNPYYVTKQGLIFNNKGCIVLGSLDKKYNLRLLSYTNVEGIVVKTPFTKIVFSTFRPEIPLKNCTIVRIGDKEDYSLSNLKCVNNKKMPKHIGLLTEENFSKLKRVGTSFYEDLTLLQQNTFMKLLRSKTHTNKFLASRYGVSEMAIYRAKRKLKV